MNRSDLSKVKLDKPVHDLLLKTAENFKETFRLDETQGAIVERAIMFGAMIEKEHGEKS